MQKENTKLQRAVILGMGFIGKNLCDFLKAGQIEVLPISRKELDLSREDAVTELKRLLRTDDSVVFLSAITPSKGKGTDAFFENIQMARNVCKFFENNKIGHFIYLSSDAVYPLFDGIITEESFASPEDLYGTMHLAREQMFKSVVRCPYTILRSTLLYGFEDPHNSYGPNRLRRMGFKEKRMVLFGQGEEKRDHLFIKDLVRLLLLILQDRCEGIFNLASGSSISYGDLAKKMRKLFEEDVPVEFTERKNAITHRHFNVSKIYKMFPFFSFTSIEEGLKIVHREELKSNV